MDTKNLKNPPLVEAIFEIKWDVSKVPEQVRKDNKIIAGMLLNKIEAEYPHYEALEISNAPIPEEMVAGLVQHRFRAVEKGSPLIQIGAGVFTTNHINEGISKNYDWKEYKNAIVKNCQTFNDMYPVGDAVNSISFKYINALEFDFEKDNIVSFLKEKMGIDILLPFLSEANPSDTKPVNFNLSFTYPYENPNGVLKISFSSGKKTNGKDILVWHIDFISRDLKVQNLPEGLEGWLDSSHDVIEKTFLKLIENLKDVIN